MDDHDLVDGLGDLCQHMARDEDRPTFPGEPAQEVPKPTDPLRVEPVRGLVEDEHLRVAEQRRCETEALTHSEGVALHAAPARLPEIDERQHLVDPGPRDAPRQGEHSEVVSSRPPGCASKVSSKTPTRRTGSSSSRYCRPSTVVVPAVGLTSPRITRIVVDFPHRSGPRNPVIVPGFTEKERSSTASVEPNLLVSPSTSITAGRSRRPFARAARRTRRRRSPARSREPASRPLGAG